MGRSFPEKLLSVSAAGVPVNRSGGRPRVEVLRGYSIAMAFLVLALGVATLALRVGQFGTYLPLALAVIAAAWFEGVGPALLCQGSGAFFAFFYLIQPKPVTPSKLMGLVLFVVISSLALFLTASVRENRHLRKSTRRLTMIAAATNDCFWDWDLKTGQVIRTGNLAGVFGPFIESSNSPAVVSWWQERIHPEDRESVWGSLEAVLAGTADQWRAEYRLRRSDGSYGLVADQGTIDRDRVGRPYRMIGGMSDITAHRRAEERIAHDALHDSLTGLPNRQFFRERLTQALVQNKGEARIAVLFLDFDRFKVINDSLGHAAGDQVLRALAKRIEMSLRAGEFAARFGGDEFTILLESIATPGQAQEAANRLLKALALPYLFEGHSLVVSASIGIALAELGQYPEEVLRFADVAMYRAKSRGRGRHEMFESSVDAPTMNVLQLESEMRRSLADHDFRVYYQPIVALSSGHITGFEALLRWQHPRRGLLLPGEFLALAEESGLVTELGYWTMQTACRDLSHWQSMGTTDGADVAELAISINLAGKQFRDPELVSHLRQVLTEQALAGESLILELTENMILENNAFVTTRLEELREMGIRLAIDDFGREHSSFGRLQDLQVSILKIDGSFVRRIAEGKPEIVDAIVSLAKRMKLDVTAECVETTAQFEHLSKSRCTYAQGLYFSGALTSDGATELLRTNPRWRLPLKSAAGS